MKKLKAFTLVEVLTVIVIFGVWILTVLYGISQTIYNKEIVKMQFQTSFLWREGIELLYNLRDSNFKKEFEWNCIFKALEAKDVTSSNNGYDFCKWWLFDSWTVMKISIGTGRFLYVETGSLQDDFWKNFESFRLYKCSSWDFFQYGYTGECTSWEETNYARYLLFKSLTESWNILPTGKVLKVESHVLYNGTFTGEDIIETILWNHQF